MNVLVVDVGGTHVKILATGQKQFREFPSGPTLSAKQMVGGVKKLARDWKYDGVSIGYPGPVIRNRPLAEPHNLGRGWMGCDFKTAFKRPVKVVNDAAMQALGSYKGGKMLFLGLGTGLGSAMIADGIVEPMELGHLPYKKRTFEDYVGVRGYDRLGTKKSSASPHAHKVPDPRSHRHRRTSLLGGCSPRPGRFPGPGGHSAHSRYALPIDAAQRAPARRLVRHAKLARRSRHHPDLDVRY